MKRCPGLKRIVRACARRLGEAHDIWQYRPLDKAVRSHTPVGSKLAVVVHAHHPEVLPEIAEAVRRTVPDLPVFVTTAASAADSAVQSVLPGAVVLRVPNRGRDLLPFLRVSDALRSVGVTGVLKLHTKRSPHVEWGDTWLTTTLNELLPNVQAAGACREAIESGVPLVGPSSYFLRTDVYLRANRKAILAELDRIGVKAPEGWETRTGFFAGTMFWSSLDVFLPWKRVPLRWFPPEPLGADGTYAHALERLVCLVPQLEGRGVLCVDEAGGLRPQPPESGTRPEWADEPWDPS